MNEPVPNDESPILDLSRLVRSVARAMTDESVAAFGVFVDGLLARSARQLALYEVALVAAAARSLFTNADRRHWQNPDPKFGLRVPISYYASLWLAYLAECDDEGNHA